MVLVWSAFFLSLVSAIPIGLQAGLGITAVINFKNQALPYIVESIGTTELDNIVINEGAGGLFALTAYVTNLVLGDLQVNTTASTVVFVSPDTIQLNIQQISGASHFDWGYVSLFAEGAGSGRVTLSNTNALVEVELAAVDYKLNVTVSSITVTIQDITIQLSGNPSAKYVNWLLSTFKYQIQAAVSQNLEAKLTEAIQEKLDELLYESSTLIYLGAGLAINYSLPQSPTVASQYIELYSQAVIVEISNPVSDPPIAQPVALPYYNQTGGQIQISVSSYTVNSGLYAAVNANLLDFNITNQDLPIPLLYTNTLDVIIPGMSAKYGQNQACYMSCVTEEYPSIDFVTNSTQGAGTFDCSIIVVSGNQVAVDLALTAEFVISVEVANWAIQGTVDNITISDITVISNAVGSTINVEQLENMLNMLLKLGLGTLNQYLAEYSFPLPIVDGVDLTNSTVTTEEGYILIQATPEYDFVSTSDA